MIDRLKNSKNFIESKLPEGYKIDVAVTLGSGLSTFAELLSDKIEIPFGDIPGFIAPSVAGHPGQLVFGKIENKTVLLLQGRIHFYEGHTLDEVVFATRVVGQLNCSQLLLTNSAGGFLDKMQAGEFMIITDHINLTGQNPLIGKNLDELGPRFPDMTEVYNKEIVQLLEKSCIKLGLKVHKGIYCGVTGPSYETPAEIMYLKTIGGGAVGMSTVAEAIAASHMGLKIGGLSCITNLAAGISPTKLTHEEVKDIAGQSSANFKAILKELILGL